MEQKTQVFCQSDVQEFHLRLCLLSGILNIGGLEILLLSAPPPYLDSGGGDLPPSLGRGGGDLPPALASLSGGDLPPALASLSGGDLPPALDSGGGDPPPFLDIGGGVDLPPEDEQLLFQLLRRIGELCGSGASSLGYQAFSLLRLWCQRLQGGEHLKCFFRLSSVHYYRILLLLLVANAAFFFVFYFTDWY
jgi:hypothetical protein